MSLTKYIAKRILYAIPVVFGVLIIIFILSRLIPGDQVLSYLTSIGIYPEGENFLQLYQQLRHELWLDTPIFLQFVRYLMDTFSGNWGYSVSNYPGQEVWSLIMLRLPRTIDIALFSILISIFLGIKLGVISASHRNKSSDTVLRGLALLGVSIPIFFLGNVLQYFLSLQLGWFPATGFKNRGYSDPDFISGFRIIDALFSGEFYLIFDYLHHLILPVFCLSFVTLGTITRQSRSSMLEVLEQDYVRTARAKGVNEKDVYRQHALKNSLLPTTTVIGLNLASVLSGTVLTEVTFDINGIGTLLVDSIFTHDFWVVNALIFVITIMYLSMSIAIDIGYSIIDPRIRY
ncbi:MAG: ABC transporter permease [Promethearchaeota archaeon]